MMSIDRLPDLGRFQNPEYTGKNRCMPCTGLNVGIALVIGITAWILISTIVAGIVLIVSLVLIYYRGYLLPYTPVLTKRFFPERVLRWFGKQKLDTETSEPTNEENLVASFGFIESAGDDIQLSPSFAADWKAEIAKTRDQIPQQLAKHLDLSDPEIQTHNSVCIVRDQNEEVTRWLSQPALIADLAALSLLQSWVNDWQSLSESERSRVLTELRVFLEECPDCGGELVFDTEMDTESCCYGQEVTVYRCADCRSLLTRLR